MILALTGLAGCGKSTAAAYLAEHHGFARVRFAGPLKAMLRAFYAAAGLAPDAVEAKIEGGLKEYPCTLLGGRSPRHAMQTIGAEWGRDLMSPDLWVLAWSGAAGRAIRDGAAGVVVEDCRYENEAAAVRSLGGRILRIERPGLPPIAGNHGSEGRELPRDGIILNDGDTDLLGSRLDFAVRRLARAA